MDKPGSIYPSSFVCLGNQKNNFHRLNSNTLFIRTLQEDHRQHLKYVRLVERLLLRFSKDPQNLTEFQESVKQSTNLYSS